MVVITWLATRAVLLLVARQVMADTGSSLTQVLSQWDVAHYLTIAEHGYRDPLDVAFFPGLPLLMRLLAAFGVPMVLGAAALAQLASALAAWL